MKFMKLQSLFITLLIVAGSCSSPRYFTDFNKYSFQVNKRESALAKPEVINSIEVDPGQLMASMAPQFPPSELKAQKVTGGESSPMFNVQKKELRKEIKANIKRVVKEVKRMDAKSVQAAQRMDGDLKLALIFGIIGLILGGLFGLSEILAFIGAVAIIVALVFLIKWLIRQ